MANLDRLSRELSEEVFQVGDSRPSPVDFIAFLPWACNELEVEQDVVVKKIVRNDYVSISHLARAKLTKSKHRKLSDAETQTVAAPQTRFFHSIIHDIIKVVAVYSGENLVEITFDGNSYIPRLVLKIICMILHYHVYLQKVNINQGLDMYTVHELSKWLPHSNITDICLDGTSVKKQVNYHLLLDNPTSLKHLSLARCNIDDEIVKVLAARLAYPLPATKTLALLNLSSNMITDIGAKHLSEALRSNRKLNYLNLANNLITDVGADAIFSCLVRFQLKYEEVMTTRRRYIQYTKEMLSTVSRLLIECKDVDEKRLAVNRKRTAKPLMLEAASRKSKKNKDAHKEVDVTRGDKSIFDTDAVMFAGQLKKAETMALNLLGEFKDPFNSNSSVNKDGLLYCIGNDVLCYMNLGYNNLSYLSLKKLISVLQYQERFVKRPKGLVAVTVEGNPLPVYCEELIQIDYLLGSRRASLQLPKKSTRMSYKKI